MEKNRKSLLSVNPTNRKSELTYCWSGEALELIAQSSSGCPILGRVEEQVGGPWAASSCGWQLCPQQGIVTGWTLRSRPTQTIL